MRLTYQRLHISAKEMPDISPTGWDGSEQPVAEQTRGRIGYNLPGRPR